MIPSTIRTDLLAAGAGLGSLPTRRKGWANWRCRAEGVDLVVMEATGGLERLAVLLLWREGLACALADPRQVRAFAEAVGRREKTDRIDTGLIARFGPARKVAPTPLLSPIPSPLASPPPSPGQVRLKALVARLGQMTGDLTVNKKRDRIERFF